MLWAATWMLASSLASARPDEAGEPKTRLRGQDLEEIAPWATEPDRVKLDIVQRLVLEKQQYATALPLIAAMRKEGLRDPVLDLVQGVAMREQGLKGEAESLLLEARRRMPGDARVHDALCVLYADLQSLDQAIDSCEKATRIDQNRASAWNNLGYLYLVTGRSEDAVEACKHATDLDSGDARYRNNLALALVAVGDQRRALDLFATTGTPADARYNVGAAIERFQGPTDALSWYRDALIEDPEHRPAAEAVARIAPEPEPSPKENAP